MKLPALQFYVGDWRKDIGVQSLSYHDRGVWFEMLCLMHESEQRGKLILNGRAMSEDELARLLGLDKQILTTTLTTILTSAVASRCEETGAIMSRRMVKDENLRKIRQNAGILGGNPVLVKQKSTTQLKQIPTPSSSSSSSSSNIKEKIYKKESFKKPTLQECLAYGKEIGFDGALFFDGCEARGWKAGRVAMKDWKAAMRTWKRNQQERNNPKDGIQKLSAEEEAEQLKNALS